MKEKGVVEDEIEIQKKEIVFKNPYTKEIIARVQLPRTIHMSEDYICDLDELGNRLKLLYVDVLCRGYHPVKGFQAVARNVFKQETSLQKDKNKARKTTKVSNVEALGTIWRCLGRQLGRPIKNYNLGQVELQLFDKLEQLKEVKISKKTGKRRRPPPEMMELLQIENQIKKEFFKIAQRYKFDQQKAKQSQGSIARVMGLQILELEREIFLRTVIGIRQWESNIELVEILLEQSYPSIKMSRAKAKELLTQKVLLEKSALYESYRVKFSISQDDPLIVCHRCLVPLNDFGKSGQCNGSHASLNVVHSVLTDPYLYNRMVINENCWDQEVRKYIHPYLLYYRAQDDDKAALCNRFYCNKCEGVETVIRTKGHCNYCDGICDCYRCSNMDLLTRMMAVFIDNKGDLDELTKKFLLAFDGGKSLNYKSKNKPMGFKDGQTQFKEHLECFFEGKVVVSKRDLPNYRRVDFFKGQDPETEKYRIKKVQIGQSPMDRRERLEKERKSREQVMRINKSLQQLRSQNKVAAQEKKPQQAEEQAGEKPGIYYEDSDS